MARFDTIESSLPPDPNSNLTPNEFAFSCKWMDCNENFLRLGDLVDHVKASHCGLNQPFPRHFCEWEGCWRQTPFANQNNMIYHMRAHTGERPFECKLCGTRFSVRSNYNAHARTVHAQPKLVPKVIHFDETRVPLPPNGNGHTPVVRNQHTKLRDLYWEAKKSSTNSNLAAPPTVSKLKSNLTNLKKKSAKSKKHSAPSKPASKNRMVSSPCLTDKTDSSDLSSFSFETKFQDYSQPKPARVGRKKTHRKEHRLNSNSKNSKFLAVRQLVHRKLQECREVTRVLVSKLRYLEVAEADLQQSEKFYRSFPDKSKFSSKLDYQATLKREAFETQERIMKVLDVYLEKIIPSIEKRLEYIQTHAPTFLKKLRTSSSTILALNTPPLSPDIRPIPL